MVYNPFCKEFQQEEGLETCLPPDSELAILRSPTHKFFHTAMSQDYCELIKSLPIFQGYTDHGAQNLINLGQTEEHPPETVIFTEGAPPDSVLLVLKGRIKVYVERGGKEVELNEVGPGSILGELAVLGQMPRAASVRTMETSTLLRWTDQAFRRLLLGNAFLSEKIFAASVKMLIEKEQSLIKALVQAQEIT